MKKILNITDATLLALHSMALIARENQVSARDISVKINVNYNHLTKVLQHLTKNGFIESVRGPAGGFKLGKEKENISLLEIYECVEGKLERQDCLIGNSRCFFSECILSNINKQLSEQFIQYLEDKKLSDF